MFETMNPPSDEDLMIDIQAGDQEAFRELMQRYERLLHCHIAQKLGGDWHTAHDISQKVFLKIFTKNETFIPGCKVQPWLYAIASNATVDYLRREKKYSCQASLDQEREDSVFRDSLVAKEDHSIGLCQQEMIAKLRACIVRLPLQYQEVIVLAALQEQKYSQISEALGIPIGTVKSRRHNAVELLKDLMEAHVPLGNP